MNHLNWDVFLKRLDSNQELALELAGDFLKNAESRWILYQDAMESADCKKIEHAAHLLRGFIAPYGGTEALQILKKVEAAARQGDSFDLLEAVQVKWILDQLLIEIGDVVRKSGQDMLCS